MQFVLKAISLIASGTVGNGCQGLCFDTQSTANAIDTFGLSFGNYTRLLTNPRVMQFALRFEF